jgi:hypothetical protein
MGYVYIVIAVGFERIKIGFWNSTIPLLKNRYITPYGSDLKLLIALCTMHNFR